MGAKKKASGKKPRARRAIAEQRARNLAAERERRRRLDEYDAEVARLSGSEPSEDAPSQDRPRTARRAVPPRLRILAEGDSWFDFPFGGRALRGGDVIERLRELVPYPIMNLAVRGDDTRRMLGVAQRERLIELLEDEERDFNVLLFSGGGNDIAGDCFRLWLRERDNTLPPCAPPDPVFTPAFDHALGVVRAAYEDLLDLRDQVAAQTPGRRIAVFLHAYDWAIPSGRGVCGFGPWLKPSLDDRGWLDPAEARGVVRLALGRFARMLEGVAAGRPDVWVVPTQGLLGDGDWHDELHPNRRGFAAIAGAFRETMGRALGF